jgi:hypothetical protein
MTYQNDTNLFPSPIDIRCELLLKIVSLMHGLLRRAYYERIQMDFKKNTRGTFGDETIKKANDFSLAPHC